MAWGDLSTGVYCPSCGKDERVQIHSTLARKTEDSDGHPRFTCLYCGVSFEVTNPSYMPQVYSQVQRMRTAERRQRERYR